MAILEAQIAIRLKCLAHREISLGQFAEWFVPISIQIEQSHDAEAIELAHRIDGILSEASSAQWSEEDIYEELSRPFLSEPVAGESSVFGDPNLFSTAASNVSVAA